MEHCIDRGHPLVEVYGSKFQCDGCKIPGSGRRYRCHTCDFNLHDCCGRCPSTLFTFMHPQHHLELVIEAPQPRRCNLKNIFHKKKQSFCDLCGDNIEGLFYRCKICDFDIHPVCTKLPECVPHVLHRDHPLKLHKTSSPCWCRVCKSECSSWRYGCRTCSFDIHLECILKRCDASSTPSRSLGPTHYGSAGYAYGGQQYPYCSSAPPLYPPPPPPTHCGAYVNVHPSPTHLAAYVYPYAYAPPPPSHGAYAHGGHPGLIPHGANHSLAVTGAEGNGQPSKWRKSLGKIIFSLVTNLTAGLLSGVVFGT